MIAAIVAPAGVRSIARMRACLVSGRVEVFGDEWADRERGLDLPVVRADERVDTLDFDLDLVMGSSEVMRRHPPHHPSPARAKPRQGKTPKRAFATSSHHSNAPIKPESQSNLSKIVALFSAIMVSAGGLFSVSSMVTGNAKIGGLDRNCLHRQTTRKRGPSPIGHWRETGCSLGLAAEMHDHGLSSTASVLGAGSKPLRQGAVLLV